MRRRDGGEDVDRKRILQITINLFALFIDVGWAAGALLASTTADLLPKRGVVLVIGVFTTTSGGDNWEAFFWES